MYRAEIQIDDLTEWGEGVARLPDGKVVFVDNALPGERLLIQIVTERKQFAKAQVASLLSPSPLRQTPPCSHFGSCGGCLLQHLQHQATLSIKANWICSAFHKIASISLDAVEMLEPLSPLAYRNKATFHGGMVAGQYQLSFYQKKSHRLFDLTECLILPDALLQLHRQITALCRQHALFPSSVMMRTAGGPIQLVASFPPSSPRHHQHDFYQVVTQAVSLPLSFPSHPHGSVIEMTLAGQTYLVGGQSFFQVHTKGAEQLYALLRRLLSPLSLHTLYDLYCGVGSIGLSLADLAVEVVGIEIVPEAVRLAQQNASKNNIANFRCLQGAVESSLSSVQEKQSCVILDPPRGGVAPLVLDHLLAVKPTYLLYIGCGLGAMARDLKRLHPVYQVVDNRVYGIDLFPYSGHVETVCLLSLQ